MPQYEYTRPHRLNRLHDELLAAGITPQHVLSQGDTIWIITDAEESAVRAVITAHDPAAADSQEQAVRQEWTDLLKQVDDAVAAWTTLTTAQKVEALRAVLRILRRIAR